jgi:hypothetical protein
MSTNQPPRYSAMLSLNPRVGHFVRSGANPPRHSAASRVHVVLEVTSCSELPMAAVAQAGKGLDWLAE